ncbi:hypothetical protein D082_08100 [Synechocystis sp. PCC 6714]|nr:hypothetical protein D082_08100 [Synechocystis sp. PCC 6714]
MKDCNERPGFLQDAQGVSKGIKKPKDSVVSPTLGSVANWRSPMDYGVATMSSPATTFL